MSVMIVGGRRAIQRVIVRAVARLDLSKLKKSWLNSFRTWGDSGLASVHLYMSPLQVAQWRAEDREFDAECREIEQAIEGMVLNLANQRANQGDAAARRVASRMIQAKKSSRRAPEEEIAAEPPIPRPPVTQEQARAHIRAILEADGVEIPEPGELSIPVYSAEQWAKWGR